MRNDVLDSAIVCLLVPFAGSVADGLDRDDPGRRRQKWGHSAPVSTANLDGTLSP